MPQVVVAQEPPPPPPPSTQFGTLLVRQNDNLNTSTSITMFRGTGGTLRWEPVPFSSSRADFAISFLNENDFTAGALVASVAQNGRNNNPFGDTIGQFYATVAVATFGGIDPPTAYYFATSRAAQGSEVNVDLGFGYFPYDQWLGGTGWIASRGNGLPLDRFNGSPGLALGSNLIDIGSGVTLLDLRSADPTATPANGILLVNHAKNEDNYASSEALPDGTWRLRVRDNGSNGTGTEQDPVTFVYLPLSKIGTDGLQAMGLVNSDASTDVAAGDFTLTKAGVGRWHLAIPDATPLTGTLLISPAGGGTNTTDNIVSYQWDPGNNLWVIESRDIINTSTLPALEDGGSPGEDMFSFAFFGAPLLPDVLVSAPLEGQIFTSPAAFAVTADASDFNGAVTQVEFFRNGKLIGTVTEEPYTVQEAGLDGGRYQYVARATDTDGQAISSTPVTAIVRVDPENPPAQTALFFDGLVENVTLDRAPELGVGGPPTKGLTLEGWFRKEGPGATASSGVGGIVVQPLFAKGRGESDNNTTDTNYLVGITRDGLLAADFEAIPSPGVTGGANFPVFGTHDPIEDGRWYHAAVTYDGVAGVWKLYLDGVEVGSRDTIPGAMPRYDSNHRFAIGAALNTSVQRAGSFFGAIDEVRVWNYARSAEDIAATKDASIVSAFGLVGRFGLDEGTGVEVASSTGDIRGVATGPEDGDGLPVAGWQPLWVAGAPLTKFAPSLVLQEPVQGSNFRGTTPILIRATASDSDGSIAKVEFFDGDNRLAERGNPPYQFVWTGATPGPHTVRAVATDNDGVVASQFAGITVVEPSPLLLTELHSSPSAGAPAGVGDYWELTHFGTEPLLIAGYTWHDSARNRAAALAWALPAGTEIAPGESLIFTPADPVAFRNWWGLPDSVRVIQSTGAPGLGENDGVALYDASGNEVFYFSYAAGGFTRAEGLPALGGHAGRSAGGLASDALVWEPASGLAQPRYHTARAGENGAATAVSGTDVGSPGSAGGDGVDPAILLQLTVTPAAFPENAGAAAALATLSRFGDVEAALTVRLLSSDTSEATVPAEVSFAAGESTVSFDVAAVDDILADGPQAVLLTATADGATQATAQISVTDDGDIAPPKLLLTEIQSSQSETVGAADYWELTNYGGVDVDLSGYTWDDDSRSFLDAQAWAFVPGTILPAGKSLIVTSGDPEAFRAWWGLAAEVQIVQTAGAPGLGQNDGVALFDAAGRELFYVSYAEGGFQRPDGSQAVGGHAGLSAGGDATDALVWDVVSGTESPRYVAAVAGRLEAFQAPGATDVGSPGRGAVGARTSYTLQLLHYGDAEAGELALDAAPGLAALVEGFEQQHERTLVVMGGDSFLAGPFLNAGADPALNALAAVGVAAPGRANLAIHNLIGVEASAVGHHEWDLGSGVFMEAVAPEGDWSGANYPLLSLNLDFQADNAAAARFTSVARDDEASAVPEAATVRSRLVPATVVVKGGEKIGLLGVTTPLLAQLSRPTGTVAVGGGVVDLDALAQLIQPWIEELEAEGADKIVLLSHLGDLDHERALAGKLRGADVIVASGSGARLSDVDDVAYPGQEAVAAGSYPLVTEDRDGTPVLIVGTQGGMAHLGRLVVDFDLEGRVVVETLAERVADNGAYAATAAQVAAAWGVTEEAVEATAYASGSRGAQVRQVTEAVRGGLATKDREVLGYTAVHLEGERARVRSEETNLGNLTADAALAAVSGLWSEGVVSLRHAGSVHGSVGSFGGAGERGAPEAATGKPAGAVTRLDVESVLRGDHGLMVLETTVTGLKALLEHGVSEGAGSVRYPQVGGLQMAWDPARAVGQRVRSLALVNGGEVVPLFKAGAPGNGVLPGAPAVIRVVTLDVLANGGEGYPAKANGANFRRVLEDGTLGPVLGEGEDFLAEVPGDALGEQALLAWHLEERHGNLASVFVTEETAAAQDERIQNLGVRSDSVPPVLGLDSDGDGLEDFIELLIGGDPASRLRVGDRVELNLAAYAGAGRTVRLVGKLPPGLQFDAATGRLTGVLGGVSMLHDLQMQVLEGGELVRTVVLPLAVDAFPARLLGSYEALLENDGAQPIGLVRVVVTQSGQWSASLDLLGAGRRSAKGGYELVAGRRQAKLQMAFKAAKTVPQTEIELTLDADQPQIAGEFSGAPQSGNVRGVRLATLGGSPPLTRRLNVAFDAGAQDGVEYPAGLGWAKGSISNRGALKLAGFLGDGTKLTLAVNLSATGQALAWVQPYKNKQSYFGGVLPLPDLGQPSPLLPVLAEGVQWFKAADAKDKAYPAGFNAPLAVDVIARGYGSPATAQQLADALGLEGLLLGVELEGAGLSNAPEAQPPLPTTLALQSNFALVSEASVGAAAWTGKVAKADGAFAGSLTLPAGGEILGGKAAVSGVLLPEPVGDVIGAGFIRVPMANPRGTFRTASFLLQR